MRIPSDVQIFNAPRVLTCSGARSAQKPQSEAHVAYAQYVFILSELQISASCRPALQVATTAAFKQHNDSKEKRFRTIRQRRRSCGKVAIFSAASAAIALFFNHHHRIRKVKMMSSVAKSTASTGAFSLRQVRVHRRLCQRPPTSALPRPLAPPNCMDRFQRPVAVIPFRSSEAMGGSVVSLLVRPNHLLICACRAVPVPDAMQLWPNLARDC